MTAYEISRLQENAIGIARNDGESYMARIAVSQHRAPLLLMWIITSEVADVSTISNCNNLKLQQSQTVTLASIVHIVSRLQEKAGKMATVVWHVHRIIRTSSEVVVECHTMASGVIIGRCYF